ncbi:hypothetical protein MF271_05110 [Deinococcus sp. KNUC1210]|uniref:hypothetical protein n=1 Tax=Deinococcus sp. KNUC1210 TaxID=2917691 RepID=UPI001EF05EBA|nr:hypothetical protein [Deinococcus sp. KNUC1210]ULH16015.1 hypothetical protein MF271_05110 [Deinococcus sp. KNUC1210]
MQADTDAVWNAAVNRNPTVGTEVIVSGCIAGRTRSFTRAQADGYHAEIKRLTAAASRNDHAKAQRMLQKEIANNAALSSFIPVGRFS